MNGLSVIFPAKATRVFVFGVVSIATPIYLATIGYSPLYVGLALALVAGGNIFSNLILVRYGSQIGLKKLLLIFSVLMLISGVILSATVNLAAILIACFIGNISTTGTEAGPFQSVETGIMPDYVGIQRTARAFGVYNLIGYSSSSIGAFASSAPAYLSNSLWAYHALYVMFALVGLFLFALYSRLNIASPKKNKNEVDVASKQGKHDIRNLSILYFVDAFGGGFLSQSLLSYWFFLAYKVSLANLGIVFFVVNVITAISTLLASLLAERLGNLKTMVSTHLLSNIFLFGIPFVGSLGGALTLLFLRQSMSQMDVPTRQAFMINIFAEGERVSANAVTNSVRAIGGIFGGPISGVLLVMGLFAAPLLAGSLSKISYDIGIFFAYRKRAR